MNRIKNFFKQFFLQPLAWLLENIQRLRRALYTYHFLSAHSLKIPVISIGNLSFGGTGKTPFVRYIANLLTSEEIARTPVILTRGHKGKLEHGAGLIKAGQKIEYDPTLYGDEPLLLARHLKKGAVVVGKKRVKNLKKFFHQILPDLVLLDDGFQHLQLARDLNIVLFDSLMELSRYQVAPMGYLREGLRALAGAQVIALGRADLASEEQMQSLKTLLSPYVNRTCQWVEFAYRPQGLFNVIYEKVLDFNQVSNQKLILLAGLANPESFFMMMEQTRATILKKQIFPDHYDFKLQDIAPLLEEATKNDAIIVTTEKDIVKIRKIVMNERLLFMGIDVELLKGKEEFHSLIQKTVSF